MLTLLLHAMIIGKKLSNTLRDYKQNLHSNTEYAADGDSLRETGGLNVILGLTCLALPGLDNSHHTAVAAY